VGAVVFCLFAFFSTNYTHRSFSFYTLNLGD